jgi:uncharacterized protein (DUF305 family)
VRSPGTTPRRRHAPVLAAVLLTGGTLALGAGCTADRVHPGDHRRSGPTVVQPGRPGEPARTLGPDAAVPRSQWNEADARFVQRMIPHHAQALRMSALARTRAQDPRVLALAERIRGARGPEVMAMSAWLAERGIGQASMEHHHHHGGRRRAPMTGMLTETRMRRLAAAEGRTFDRLFLTGMIQHHQGAVQMSSDALQHGSDLRVNEIAGDVAAEQNAEIARMRAVLRSL